MKIKNKKSKIKKAITYCLLPVACCLFLSLSLQPSAYADESPMEKGIKLAKEKKYDQALEQFKKALAEDANNPNIRYNLALVYDLQGNREEAIKGYKETIRTYPLSSAAWKAHGKLARIYKQMGKTEDAKKEIAESLRLMNENTNVKMSREDFNKKVEEIYSGIK